MAGVKLSNLKLIRRFMDFALSPQSVRSYACYTKQFARQDNSQVLVKSSSALVGCIGQEKGLEQSVGLTSCNVAVNYKLGTASAFASSQSFGMVSRSARFRTSFVPALTYRSYSSWLGGKDDKPGNTEVSAVSEGSDGNVGGGGVTVNDWVDKVKDGWQRAADAVENAMLKAKDVSNEMNPHMQQLLDSHPYLKEVVVPVGFTLGGTILAWFVMPRLFRRIHRYVMQSPAAILSGKILGEEVPYEQSFWGALEEPVRYLFTFMAFSQIAVMVAPNAIASEYLTQAWRGAAILSFVWFLYRWKTNVFGRAIASRSLTYVDREKILTLDRVSSIGLFVVGIMALAEACGVAVQSILTVGGIGGVATAFAARDVLGNMLSGLSMQFSKPFSLGDTIKAGNIEGQVVEMGLTTTSLLNAEKFPVLVPNSLFSSQAIINKSRAQWRAIITKIPLRIDDVEKVYEISDEIKSMLKSNPKVSVEREVPYCYLSRVDGSSAELTVGCNLRHMRKDEFYAAEQDILVQSVRIIKKHGAELGSSWGDSTSR